ncbi:Phosphoglycolate phosphatase, HAD superfamily [Ectopseudomonas composti]|uniref:phosphoglycolate phosphatase n=1 Tax=Ectopseudomonas composti TaxID=658457 RepID=A0A1I5JKC5_9GAMM|nr:HAD hydrolase-like protein [Pseudomonas composti]SFO72993.1 Phosphoglycolate phosphatase, HAD superfamily [Pseudomonas composti]
MQSLSQYATLIFDCDGVLLDSNAVKTRAFGEVTERYGMEISSAFVDYHVRNGGVSRYQKFRYLFSDLLRRQPHVQEAEQLLQAYADKVREGLLTCAVADGLAELREVTAPSGWLVASGGDQQELRQIFQMRELTAYFDHGIHGSPAPKNQILQDALSIGKIQLPALFIGDSRFDHVCAKQAGLDFVFVYRWSEFPEWQEYCRRESVASFEDISALLRAMGPL